VLTEGPPTPVAGTAADPIGPADRHIAR
jgi:hypothetical protein